MSTKDEPAFPRDHAHDGHNGMTLRDYFAAKAMQGLLMNALTEEWHRDDFTRRAYGIADSMLAAREATP